MISNFEMVYGVEANFPLPLELSTYKLGPIIEDNTLSNRLEKRIMYITHLNKERVELVHQITHHHM